MHIRLFTKTMTDEYDKSNDGSLERA